MNPPPSEGGRGRIRTGSLFQVRGEDGRLQLGHGVVEEGLLGRGADRVDDAEAEAEQAVRVGVLGELGRDLAGRLDGLVRDGDVADADNVGVDVAGRRAAVAVADLPRRAVEPPRRRAGRHVVRRLAPHLVARRLRAEDPEIRRARVEVEVQRLRRRADLHRAQVLRVEGCRRRLHGALPRRLAGPAAAPSLAGAAASASALAGGAATAPGLRAAVSIPAGTGGSAGLAAAALAGGAAGLAVAASVAALAGNPATAGGWIAAASISALSGRSAASTGLGAGPLGATAAAEAQAGKEIADGVLQFAVDLAAVLGIRPGKVDGAVDVTRVPGVRHLVDSEGQPFEYCARHLAHHIFSHPHHIMQKEGSRGGGDQHAILGKKGRCHGSIRKVSHVCEDAGKERRE